MPESSLHEIGKIIAVNGEAFAESSSGSRLLEPGSPIYEGEELVTGHDGNIEVRFIDDTLLSQGEDSRIALDDYAYEPDSGASEYFVDIAQGTFRMVTGKIAEQNPERFKVGSPLATIGIRGTTTVHEVHPGQGEKHGVEEIHSGKALIVQSIDGQIRQIAQPQSLVDVSSTGTLSSVRSFTTQELDTFRTIAPASIRHEQEIREERQQERQQDEDVQDQDQNQDDGDNGDNADGENTDNQNADAENQDGEAVQGEGEGAEGADAQGADAQGAAGADAQGTEGEAADGQGIEGQGVEGTEVNVGAESDEGAATQASAVEAVQNPTSVQEESGSTPSGSTGGVIDPKIGVVSGGGNGALADKSDNDGSKLSQPDKMGDTNKQAAATETGDTEADNTAEGGGAGGVSETGEDEFSITTDALADAGTPGTVTAGQANTPENPRDTTPKTTDDETFDDDTDQQETSAGTQDGDGDESGSSGGSSGSTTSDITISGTAGNDTLTGTTANEIIYGLAGDDTLDGGGGTDTLDGGTGVDLVSFSGVSSGVTVDLEAQTAQSDLGTATLLNMEGAFGTAYDDTLSGSDADNTFYGGIGNDIIDGDSGENTVSYLNAPEGVYIDLGSGTATKSGDHGIDQISHINNVIGSTSNDSIIGDENDNTFYDVELSGAETHDFYGGEAGYDTVSYEMLTGGVGVAVNAEDTTATVGDSMDYFDSIEAVRGSQYSDTFTGSSGADTFYGYTGNDILYGSAGNDVLSGQCGNDTIYSGSGNNVIDGGNDLDTLIYETSDSVILNVAAGTAGSATGDDSFTNIESFKTGSGDDTLIGSTANETLDGGSGSDLLSYADASNGVSVDLSDTGTQSTGQGSDVLLNIENLEGSAYADTLTATDSGSTIDAGAGNDSVLGGDGDDLLYSDSGNNYFSGGSGSDSITGGSGNDTIFGGSGADHLKGGSGQDTFVYEALGDSSVSSESIDDFTSGSDTIDFSGDNYSSSALFASVSGTYDGLGADLGVGPLFVQDGNGYLWYDDNGSDAGGQHFIADVSGTVAGSDLTVDGTVISGGGSSGIVITGTENADTLSGTSGADTISGLGGDDTIAGNGGNDTVYGGSGNDYILGGSGSDTIYGGDGSQDVVSYSHLSTGITLNITDGTAVHSSGTDTISEVEEYEGSCCTDTIYSGTGSSSIDGGTAVDTLIYDTSDSVTLNVTAGTAVSVAVSDTFTNIESFKTGSGDDTLIGSTADETLDGGSGSDLLSYADASNGVSVDLSDTGTQSTGQGSDVLLNIENLEGSAYADTLTATDYGSTISAGAGDDSITGGSGNDSLLGGAGSDSITGGAGNDTIFGGSGDDHLKGGSGQDTFVYEALGDSSVSSESIDDFTSGSDTIDFSSDNYSSSALFATVSGTYDGLGADLGVSPLFVQDGNGYLWYDDNGSDAGGQHFIADVSGTVAGSDLTVDGTVISGGGSSGIVITGTENADTLSGTSGADTISGLGGDDTIAGNGGNDTVYGGSGNDYILGGSGSDTIYGGDGSQDVVSYSDLSTGITLDATAGTAVHSSGTDTITEVEGYIGSSAADTITGTSGEEYIEGGEGDDILDGGYDDAQTSVDDWDVVSYEHASGSVEVNLEAGTSSGADGNDTLSHFEEVIGSDYADSLTGSSDDNLLEGRAGDDSIDGGDGCDVISYQHADGAVQVDLSTETSTGADGNDTFVNIEAVYGSEYGDELTGDSDSNEFRGRGGDDTIDGGDGFDTVDYKHASSGVYVNLEEGTATGGDGNDTLISIEGVVASKYYNDTIIGDSGTNSFVDRGTTDDTYDGNGGSDILSYYKAVSGVSVDLNAGTAWGGAGSDTLIDIDSVLGSSYDDTITGNSSSTETYFLEGLDGNDVLTGGGIYSQLTGGEGTDTLITGSGMDILLYTELSEGGDTVSGFSGTSDYFYFYGDDFTSEASFETVSSDYDGSATLGTSGPVFVYDTAGRQLWYDTNGDDAGGNTLIASMDGGDDLTIDNIYVNGSTLTGNTGAQVLTGTGSADTLNGGDNDNTIYGLGGDDELYGNGGDDTIYGGEDNDTLVGGAGSNVLDGGDGSRDLVSYEQSDAGIIMDVGAGTVTHDTSSSVDTISNFEGFKGSDYADSMTGSSASERFFATSGNDYMDGGAGEDTVSYASSSAAVVVDLGSSMAGGPLGTDTLLNFEDVVGSDYADSIVGNSEENLIEGGKGDDILDGGDGADTVKYNNAAGSVTVSLSDGTSTGADGEDTLYNFEGIQGSAYADNLIGNTDDNNLRGGAGDDTIDGGDGTDTVEYRDASSGVYVDLENGTATGGDGSDTLISIEGVSGSSNYGDTIIGCSGDNDFIDSWTTDDTYTGNGGFDTIDYSGASSGVVVDLASETAAGGGGSDKLFGISGVTGTDYADTLVGSDGSQGTALIGGDGDDVITGGSYLSAITGGDGADTITSGSGYDGLLYTGLSDGGDTIIDFSHALDTFFFVGGDFSSSSLFKTVAATYDGSNGGIDSTGPAFVFDSLNGDFWYDSNGDAAGGNTLIASMSGGDDVQSDNILVNGAALNPPASTMYGTSGSDTLIGTSAANAIYGYEEADTLYGMEGNDTLYGGDGEDLLIGGTGDDILYGEELSDTLFGMNGNDSIYGGDGEDILSGGHGDDYIDGGTSAGDCDRLYYAAAGSHVTVDLDAGTASGGAGEDTFVNIEGVIGSQYDDHLIGDSGDNIFWGMEGDDSIVGGAGTDTIDYEMAGGAVTVDLSNGVSSGADGSDVFSGIERVSGSDYNDKFFSSSDSETIDGCDGTDVVSYEYISGGIHADLSATTATVTEGTEHDTLYNIEGIIGTADADTLIGSDSSDTLMGNGGDDYINGGDGSDYLQVGVGYSVVIGGSGTDFLQFFGNESISLTIDMDAGTATGSGTAVSFSQIEAVISGDGVDTITGHTSGAEMIAGGGGADSIQLHSGVATTLLYNATTEGGDIITDFTSGEDSFSFNSSGGFASDAGFMEDGTVSGSTDAYFVYDSGNLYYDADGDGSGSQQLVAEVHGDAVHQSDISVF